MSEDQNSRGSWGDCFVQKQFLSVGLQSNLGAITSPQSALPHEGPDIQGPFPNLHQRVAVVTITDEEAISYGRASDIWRKEYQTNLALPETRVTEGLWHLSPVTSLFHPFTLLQGLKRTPPTTPPLSNPFHPRTTLKYGGHDTTPHPSHTNEVEEKKPAAERRHRLCGTVPHQPLPLWLPGVSNQSPNQSKPPQSSFIPSLGVYNFGGYSAS